MGQPKNGAGFHGLAHLRCSIATGTKGEGGDELEQFCRIKVGTVRVFSSLFHFFLFFVERAESRVIDKSTAAYARSAISIGYLKATIG